MKNRQWILKTLSVLLVLSVLSASFGALIVFAEDGDGAQANSVTYGDKWDGSTDTEWDAVEGKEKTYSITSGAELAGLAAQVNNKVDDYEGYTFLITKNIDLNGAEHNWTPIADHGTDETLTFNGTLKGALGGDTSKPVTIGNMAIKSATMRSALIGTQEGGGIENITMKDATVTKTTKKKHGAAAFVSKAQGDASYSNLNTVNFTLNVNAATSYYGGIVGVVGDDGAEITFTNCTVNGFTINTKKAIVYYIGGFVGDVQKGTSATFTNCSVTGVKLDSTVNNQRVGGFVGNVAIAAEFKNCSATDVTISTTGTGTYIGGFAGHVAAAASFGSAKTDAEEATTCTVTNVTISTVKGSYIGGFAGDIYAAASVTSCNVTTATISTGGVGKIVGGFVGRANAATTFDDCNVETLDVDVVGTGASTSQQWLGGFVGYNNKGCVFNDCDVSGSITISGATPGIYVGGISGLVRGTGSEITDCTSNISIEATDGALSVTGGFIGCVYSDAGDVTVTIKDSSYTGTITSTGGSEVGGLIGRNIGTMASLVNCTMAGTVTAEGGTNVGALVGCMTGEVEEDDVMVTKIGALTMEGCTVTSNVGYDWFGVNTKDYDITLKNGDVSVVYNTLKVKRQTNVNDPTALRLIATVNGDAMTNYQRVGFKLTNSEGKVATLWTQTVYQKITADGTPVTPSDEGYGASSTYFFAVNLAGVPTNEPFTVQAFVETLDHVIVAGEVFNCCLADLT